MAFSARNQRPAASPNPHDLPEDPHLTKLSGSAQLQPLGEDTLSPDMPLHRAAAVLKSRAVMKLGAENYRKVMLAMQVVGALVAVYIAMKIVSVIRVWMEDPSGAKLRELEEQNRARAKQRKEDEANNSAATSGGKGKKGAKAANNKIDATTALDDEENASASTANTNSTSSKAALAAAAAAATLTPRCRRTRQPTLTTATSTLKGFDLVAVCQHSPCGNLLAVSERAKRSFSVFPQHKNFVSSFKTTLNVSHPLVNDGIEKPVVTSAFWSPDGCYLGVFEISTDSLVVMRNNTSADSADHTEFKPSASVSVLLRMKLGSANDLLPAPKGHLWGSQFSCFFYTGGEPAPDRFCAFQHDGSVNLFNPRTGGKAGHIKKSLGNTTVWALSDGLAAVSGSTMTETTLYRVKARDNSVSLDRFGGSFSPSGKRISHLYFSPDSSTLFMLPADEPAATISFLYNSSEIENGGLPKVSIRFEDTDFLDPALRQHLKLDFLHVAPNAVFPGKKVLFVVLRIGCDVAVHRVDCFEAMPAGGEGSPKVHRVLEVHGAHDGDGLLMGAAIVGRGRGLVTAVQSDSKSLLKCWEMNNQK